MIIRDACNSVTISCEADVRDEILVMAMCVQFLLACHIPDLNISLMFARGHLGAISRLAENIDRLLRMSFKLSSLFQAFSCKHVNLSGLVADPDFTG